MSDPAVLGGTEQMWTFGGLDRERWDTGPMAAGPIPLVGVTTYRGEASWGAWTRSAAVVQTAYVDCVARAGGRPLLLPPADGPGGAGESAASVMAALDALVLVGGGDVDPAHYGQEPGPTTSGINPERDANELALLAAALEAGVPVLAICRGVQLLDVLLGGTLHQHLPDLLGGDTHHQTAPGCFSDTTVETVGGSRVAAAMGETATVRCCHHQALDRLGVGLVVTARASDGTVEAVELEGPGFVVGVQWHPEDAGDSRLFEALVAATRA